MRARLPLAFVLASVVVAFALSGCGDSKSDSNSSSAGGATQSAAPGSTQSSGVSADAASDAYDGCINAAESLPDETAAAKVKKQCKEQFDKIKDTSKSVDESIAKAKKQCVDAANKIPNDSAKQSALDACGQLQ